VCFLQAKLLRDVDSVIAVVIALKTHYPKVDIANVIKRKPKLLLSSQQRVEEDAVKVGTAVYYLGEGRCVTSGCVHR
jgi:hypothetical protein